MTLLANLDLLETLSVEQNVHLDVERNMDNRKGGTFENRNLLASAHVCRCRPVPVSVDLILDERTCLVREDVEDLHESGGRVGIRRRNS